MNVYINRVYNTHLDIIPGIMFGVGRMSHAYKHKTRVTWTIMILCFSLEFEITDFKKKGVSDEK